jgi:hypothetical protein
MSKKNILADAIADAKSIKAAALANAKAAIAETFTPTLKSLISAELQEELDEENSLPDDLNARNKATMEEEDEETYEGDGFEKSSKDKSQEDEKELKGNTDRERKDTSRVNSKVSELDALLRELEDGEDDDAEDKVSEKTKVNTAPEYDDAEEDGQEKIDPMDEKEEDGEGDSKGADYELFQQLKKKFEPKPNQKPKDEAKDEAGDEHDDEEGADSGFDIESIIRELDADDHEEEEHQDESDGYDKKVTEKKFAKIDKNASKDGKDKIETMDEKKFMAEINKIKKDLKEVNLMNAKLLYFGRVIREQDGLSKPEKVGILKQFDKAHTVNEAKLIYGSITESMKSNRTKKSKTQIKENLGFSSKAAGVAKNTKKSNDNPVISEETVNRFRHLAGLDKS